MGDYMNKKLSIFATLLFSIIIFGCNSSVNEPDYLDDVILNELITSEESVSNFDENFDDGDATSFILDKVQTDLYPIKVGRRITRIERTFNKEVVGDSAKVLVTTKYSGFLIIAGKFNPITPGDTNYLPDTIISKPFVETVKRNVTLIRTNSRNDRNRGWKLQTISLSEGSTSVKNIQLTKVELLISGREPLVITDPLNTYFFIGDPKRDFPERKRNESVTLRVYLTSDSPEEDFVTITYGRKIAGQTYRVKRKLHLVSSVQNGDKWDKIYEGNWNIFVMHPFGRFHSIINSVTNETIFSVEGSVSSSTWGIPYKVN